MTYFKTYAGHVTAYKRGSYLPRRSKSTSESQNDSHTAPSALKRTQTRTLFMPLSAVICRSMAPRRTRSCFYACLTNCSHPSENAHNRSAGGRLIGNTRLTIEIPNSGLMDSSVCGYRGEALFDQRLISLVSPEVSLLGAVRRSRKGGR